MAKTWYILGPFYYVSNKRRVFLAFRSEEKFDPIFSAIQHFFRYWRWGQFLLQNRHSLQEYRQGSCSQFTSCLYRHDQTNYFPFYFSWFSLPGAILPKIIFTFTCIATRKLMSVVIYNKQNSVLGRGQSRCRQGSTESEGKFEKKNENTNDIIVSGLILPWGKVS